MQSAGFSSVLTSTYIFNRANKIDNSPCLTNLNMTDFIFGG